jgi:3-phosphoshikimate 1-carboxyvinyltransferase
MSEWRVRGPGRALAGAVRVPGDKSIGHRAVLLAALADGAATVRGLSGGEDNRRTVDAMRALGLELLACGPGELRVAGRGLDGLRASGGALDCGNSGTSMRLLAGLLATQPFRSTLSGDVYLHARPMRRVAAPLWAMGAAVEGAAGRVAGELYPPLRVGGAGPLRGIDWVSPVASAQVKSALLFAALYADGPTHVDEPARSRDHTERMLGAMGAPLTVEGNRVTLDPTGWTRRLAARDFSVPGDLSSAAFVAAAATLLPGSSVLVEGVGVNPTRTGFLDALAAMGGRVTVENAHLEGGEPVADLRCEAAELRAIEIAGELTVRAIDELPLLAALAAHARGTTFIRDAAELRVKESDRIAATAAMLRALGAAVEENDDGLAIDGDPAALRGGVVESHGDHRIAMAGAVCALAATGETTVRDVDNVATSFPGFAPLLAGLGAPLS